MSIESMALVLHHSNAKGTDKLVMLGIANHDGDGGAWPSIATLAIYANVQRAAVKKIIRRLIATGELLRDVQGGGTREMEDYERPNRYTLVVACPEGCAGGTKHKARKGWTRRPDGTYVRDEDADTHPHLLSGPVDNTPGPDGPRVPDGYPAGGIERTPKPSNEPPKPHEGSAQSTDRTREDRPCAECGAPSEAVCVDQQRRWHADDRHEYRATQRRAR